MTHTQELEKYRKEIEKLKNTYHSKNSIQSKSADFPTGNNLVSSQKIARIARKLILINIGLTILSIAFLPDALYFCTMFFILTVPFLFIKDERVDDIELLDDKRKSIFDNDFFKSDDADNSTMTMSMYNWYSDFKLDK